MLCYWPCLWLCRQGRGDASVASVLDINLAPRTVAAAAIPLATLGMESATFGGVPAPLYFVSAAQINAQVPWNLVLARELRREHHCRSKSTD